MKSPVLELYPTQLALGLYEVDEKVRLFRSMSAREQKDYLQKHSAPVVLGPKGRRYIVDHHHLVRACWEAGIAEVYVSDLDDFSSLSVAAFWKKLADKHWCHLYDPFGGGPHLSHQPAKFGARNGDDPFRSLAWVVKEAGGFRKSDEPFSEFQWANYFRAHLCNHPVEDDFQRAKEEAMKLCKSPKAKNLPGFIG